MQVRSGWPLPAEFRRPPARALKEARNVARARFQGGAGREDAAAWTASCNPLGCKHERGKHQPPAARRCRSLPSAIACEERASPGPPRAPILASLAVARHRQPQRIVR